MTANYQPALASSMIRSDANAANSMQQLGVSFISSGAAVATLVLALLAAAPATAVETLALNFMAPGQTPALAVNFLAPAGTQPASQSLQAYFLAKSYAAGCSTPAPGTYQAGVPDPGPVRG